MYRILIVQKAAKFLKSLPEDYKNTITKMIRELESDRMLRSSIQLKGREKCFRLRIGPFRVQYHIIEQDKTVLIYSISRRDEITYR